MSDAGTLTSTPPRITVASAAIIFLIEAKVVTITLIDDQSWNAACVFCLQEDIIKRIAKPKLVGSGGSLMG